MNCVVAGGAKSGSSKPEHSMASDNMLGVQKGPAAKGSNKGSTAEDEFMEGMLAECINICQQVCPVLRTYVRFARSRYAGSTHHVALIACKL